MALVYGLHDLETQKEMRIEEIGTSEMLDRLAMWNAEVNRVFNAIMNTFTRCDPRWNINPITRVELPQASRAQFVDEHGVAKPQIGQGYIDQGFPLFRYELSMSISYEALAKITVAEYSRELDRIMRGDMTTSMFLFWFSVFYSTNWTFSSTEDALPDIAVKAFANNDTETYIVRGEKHPTDRDPLHWSGGGNLGQRRSVPDDQGNV